MQGIMQFLPGVAVDGHPCFRTASKTWRLAETLADPYKGKTPLPRVPNYQEPFASRHPNTWNARANQYLEQSPETHNHRIHSFPPIATE